LGKIFPMKINLSILVFLIAAIASCKKESDPAKEKISSDNPVTLSKNIKVYHGERIQGVQPLPKGGSNAPAIEGPDGGSIIALAGKFAIIKPELINGEVAGYYISVDGANEYFKVDFTKPRILTNGRGIKPKKRSSLLRPFGTDSTGNTNADSSIVITLPPDIQTPDTICVTYSPYDGQGNIGQAVTTCIIVNHLGGDTASSWLPGSWRIVAERDNADSAWNNSSAPGIMEAVDGGYGYYCVTDSVTGQTTLQWKDCYYNNCNDIIAKDSSRIDKDDWFFEASGEMAYHYATTDKWVDGATSTCNQPTFTIYPFVDNYIFYGAWSAENNRFVIILEFDEDGSPEYDAIECEMTKTSDNEFILTVTDDDWQAKFKRI
jgi:hypothetical protein